MRTEADSELSLIAGCAFSLIAGCAFSLIAGCAFSQCVPSLRVRADSYGAGAGAQLRLSGKSAPSSGYIEGVIPLPVEGTWRVQFYFGSPTYDAKALPTAGFPAEAAGPPSAGDNITAVVGGTVQSYRSVSAVQVCMHTLAHAHHARMQFTTHKRTCKRAHAHTHNCC